MLTWASACGSGPAAPKVSPTEPPPITAEAQRDAALDDVASPPLKLVCADAAAPQPIDEASYACTRADGVRHGEFVRLYPDHTIELRGTYRDGLLDGPWERRHPSGAIAEQGAYAGGTKTGAWRQLGESGTLLGEYTLAAGTGIEKRWYESGGVFSEVALRGGQPHGTAKQLAPDGGVLEISRYANGKLDGARTVGTHRTLRIEESFTNGRRHGKRKLWQFTVLIAEEEYDRTGRLHGDYVLWRNRKIARARGTFEHGKRTGVWTWRDRADKKEREGSYVTGKKDGTWTEWWEGKVTFTGQYSTGKPDGTFTYYDRRGNELGSFKIAGGTGWMQTFHANRKPSTKQKLYNGLEDGLYQQLTPQGKVLVEGHYRAGQKHGAWKEWTHDRVLVLEQHWARGKLDGTTKKYVGGKLSLEATYAAGKAAGPYVEYREGKPAVTGQFADDRRTGTWMHHASDGTVVRTATYVDGVLEGPYRERVRGFVLEGAMRAGRRAGTWTKTDQSGVVRELVYSAP